MDLMRSGAACVVGVLLEEFSGKHLTARPGWGLHDPKNTQTVLSHLMCTTRLIHL